jgi:hypothetical protein
MAIREIGKPIDEFPHYEITNHGRVFNTYTGREMKLSPTVNGDLTVGLVRERIQYRRSMKGLVARAFIPGETDSFNTPIQLDGDKHNLHVDNIQWRPRWFAWEYTRQFIDPPEWVFKKPIRDVTNNRDYSSVYEAAKTNGLLFEDIRRSLHDGRRVFPSAELYIYIQ